MNGIGGCRVTPAWNGGGTVLLKLISSSYNTVSDTRIEEIQEEIMPLEYPSMGKGNAPIGHNVTVKSVESLDYNFAIDITVSPEDSTKNVYFKEKVSKSLEGYLYDLRQGWESLGETENIIIYVTQAMSRILQENADILDVNYATFKINDVTGQPVTVPEQKIPVLKSLAVNISS
jgi:hypothetical protein